MITVQINQEHKGNDIKNERKEKYFVEQTSLIIVKDGKPYETITTRLYLTPTKAYYCIWLSILGGKRGSGHDRSIEKTQALIKALKNVGITVNYKGENDREIFKAIAEKLGYTNYLILTANA